MLVFTINKTEHGHGLATARHSTLTTGSNSGWTQPLSLASFLAGVPDLFIPRQLALNLGYTRCLGSPILGANRQGASASNPHL